MKIPLALLGPSLACALGAPLHAVEATPVQWQRRLLSPAPPGERFLSLAACDLDDDGVVDVLTGSSEAGGGAIYLHQGLDPARAAAGEATALFRPPVLLTSLDEPPDSLAAGDFDADGRCDLVALRRGSASIQRVRVLYPIDGAEIETFALGAPGERLVAVELGRRDGLAELIVELEGSGEAWLFASRSGALAAAPELRSRSSLAALAARERDRQSADGLVALSATARGVAARAAARPPLEGTAALSLRLNDDAWADSVWIESDGGSLVAGTTSPLLVFAVNATDDVDDTVCNLTHCSLREAIDDANGNAGLDGIDFSLGAGTPVIAITSALPMITSPVTIDGSSGGATRVALDGGGVPDVSGAHGLRLGDGNATFEVNGNTIRDLVIHSFPGTGIFVDDDSHGNLFQGNYVGTDGAADLGNDGHGIHLSGSKGNTVGGTAASARNVISGNALEGIWVVFGFGAAVVDTDNLIQGNYIGTNAAGTSAIGNFARGVNVWAADMVEIGGTVAGAGNLISGNGTGVLVDGLGSSSDLVHGTLVQGNRIGTDASGGADLGNLGVGVTVALAVDTLVGGTSPAARNLISGNDFSGVNMDWMDNLIQGNYIGTDLAGELALGNGTIGGGFGVDLAGEANTVGGTTAGARNVISGNVGTGIRISDSVLGDAHFVHGNYIGTDKDGTTDLGNTTDGILLVLSPGNELGGADPGEGNVISGNGRFGIFLFGGSGNVVAGNFIGTDAAGAVAIGNGDDGIRQSADGAGGNTIGGTAAGARNVISANGGDGVELQGNPGSGHDLLGNRIGTDSGGAADLGNAGDGIHIVGGTHLVGGVTPGESNTVAHNDGDGVRVEDFGLDCTIAGNSLFGNGGLGIDLGPNGVTANDLGDADLANGLQNFPTVLSVTGSGGSTTIQGLLSSSPSSTFTLHFYSSPSCDPSSFGEGKTYLGSGMVSTLAGGEGSFSVPLPSVAVTVGHVVTATATDASGSTSELSHCHAAAGASDSAIFSDGFESGNTAAWSSTAP